ncbi:SpoIIE family protein phosphatase [Streptomyces tibetensis]|uniref:SpoIIE family protein phosphatase n=1 Tax=Streptomyces tibetensis TaxID=2382123 RepID=A0ABW6NA55_9ACTN
MPRVWDVPVRDSTRVRDARVAAEGAAALAGLDERRTAAAALVATELATNLLKHAEGGQVLIDVVAPPVLREGSWGGRVVQIAAVDHGPGIPDVPAALRDGFSTSRSLGAGLGTCLRLSDDFSLHSVPGRGTVAVARVSSTPRTTDGPAGSEGRVSEGGRWPGGAPPFGAAACGGLTGHAAVQAAAPGHTGQAPAPPGGPTPPAAPAGGTDPALCAAPGHGPRDTGTPGTGTGPRSAPDHGSADTGASSKDSASRTAPTYGAADTDHPGTDPTSRTTAAHGVANTGSGADPTSRTTAAHGVANTGSGADPAPRTTAAHGVANTGSGADPAPRTTAAHGVANTGGSGVAPAPRTTAAHGVTDAHAVGGGPGTKPGDHRGATVRGVSDAGVAAQNRSVPVSGVRAGGVNIPYGGAEYSGDAWAWVRAGDLVTLMLADGLGHGPEAAQASSAAVTALHRWAHLSPAASLQRLHDALRGTRGAAVALAQLDLTAGRLRFAGIGNVGARLRTDGTWRHLLSRPGIVGVHRPGTLREEAADWVGDPILILHTDGLPSRWTPPSDPGLPATDPAVTAAVTIRDASSPARPVRDDTAVAVLTSNPPERP